VDRPGRADGHQDVETLDVQPSEEVFDLSGGRPCLDFANTWSAQTGEHLRRYADLVAFGRQAGLLTDDAASRLLAEAARRPEEAAAVLERARALRGALHRVFSAAARQAAPDAADLATLNASLSSALARARIALAADLFVWGWSEDEQALDRVLWPVARSAAELLTGDELRAVRECAAQDCNWLFLDASKNRSRQWCDMRVCGNRAKARRHYQRTRESARGRSP
jgi:predicted RNA-binding Zn ribbon-like protein